MFIQLIIQMSSQLLTLLKEGELSDSGILTHFTDLIRAEIESKSELRGLSNFQVFSHFLRTNKFNFREPLSNQKLMEKINSDKNYKPYVTAAAGIDTRLQKLEDNRAYLRPDLMQEYQALKQAGITIGETNAFHLNKVIKALAIQYQTKSIRFWGKILGTRDYFVIQGSSSKTYLGELTQNSEKYGAGINSYSYWVATDILGQWSQLPLVTPQQVIGSRSFKYIFSGNLERPVISSSIFQGQEKHLLKCVVARITHSCELAPKGLYKLNEENPAIVDFEEEFKLPEVAEMNSLDAWVHLNPHILLQGRSTYFIDSKLSEEQKEALNTELAEKDPLVERFKGITEDKPYQALGFTANWTASISGETVPVGQIGKQEGTSLVYGVAVLRNLVWPGAVTVGYRGGWTNIYVGYGHRISQQFTAIKELKEVQVEAEQRTQKHEPNPAKAPEEVKVEVPPPAE